MTLGRLFRLGLFRPGIDSALQRPVGDRPVTILCPPSFKMPHLETKLTVTRVLAGLLIFALITPQSRAAEVVVVCPKPMASELAPWVQHRRGQGVDSVVISPESSAAKTLAAIITAADSRTRHVMIVGDAPVIGSAANLNQQVPIHYRPTTVTSAWRSTPTLSTDLPYGDLNGDGVTDVAVGRLPVDNARQSYSNRMFGIRILGVGAGRSRWWEALVVLGLWSTQRSSPSRVRS